MSFECRSIEFAETNAQKEKKLTMRFRLLAFAIVFAVPAVTRAQLSGPSASRPVPGAPAGVIAFIDVNVVPMDTERTLPSQTVLIEGGRITAMGPASQVKVPAGAARIEGRGRVLIPGLADMHVHLMARPPARLLLSILSEGATTVRNMDYIPQTTDYHLRLMRLRAGAKAGELWSPRFYTAGAWYTREQSIAGPNEVPLGDIANLVAAYKAAGYDFIKPYTENLEVFDSIAAAAQRVGLPLAGHKPFAASLEHAIGLMKSIEHVNLLGWYTENLIRDVVHAQTMDSVRTLAEAMRRAGVWITPTLAATFDLYPGRDSTSADYRTYAKKLVKVLQETGVSMLLGTDGPSYGEPGARIARELTAFVEAGLTPYQALLTGTRNVAAYFGTLEEMGTIAVGKRADLVLLNGSPLGDVRHVAQPAGVMLGGRWLTRTEFDQRLGAIDYAAKIEHQTKGALYAARSAVADRAQQQSLWERRVPYQSEHDSLVDALVGQGELHTVRGSQRVIELAARYLERWRAAMAPEQQAAFDPKVRAWMATCRADGYRVEVAGVVP